MRDRLLETALQHLEMGRSLLPVSAQKRPHARALLATGHKRQTPDGQTKASWRELQQTPPSADMISEWLRFPGSGLALVTGEVSGLVIIDADKGEGTERFESWSLTARAHVQTKSGGLHWYIQHPGWRVRTLQSHTPESLRLIRGIDIRADGGYAVIPPSTFPDGRYTALRDHRRLDHAQQLPYEVQHLLGLDIDQQAIIQTTNQAQPKSAAEERSQTASWAAQPRQSKTRTGEAPLFLHLLPPPPTWEQATGKNLSDELLSRAAAMVSQTRSRDETGFWIAKQLRDNRYSYAQAQEVMRRYVAALPVHNTKGEHEPFSWERAKVNLEQAYSRAPRTPWEAPRNEILEAIQVLWPHMSETERNITCWHSVVINSHYAEAYRAHLELIAPDAMRKARSRPHRKPSQQGYNPLIRLLNAVAKRIDPSID